MARCTEIETGKPYSINCVKNADHYCKTKGKIKTVDKVNAFSVFLPSHKSSDSAGTWPVLFPPLAGKKYALNLLGKLLRFFMLLAGKKIRLLLAGR